MPDSMAARIAKLQAMTTAQLREEWRRIMGEEPRSYNSVWLYKRLAWAIQAKEYGGLSARAQTRLEELLPMADVFLLPSSSESFGLVALEAMSAEVPVVAANAGGLPEVVEHGVTGYLHDPADVAGLVASALKLLTNEPLRRTMGRRGRMRARERFSTDEMVHRYVKVYESLR